EKIEVQTQQKIKEIEDSARREISNASQHYEEEIKIRDVANDILKQNLLDSKAAELAASMKIQNLENEVEEIRLAIRENEQREKSNYILKVEDCLKKSYIVKNRFKMYIECLVFCLFLMLSLFSSSYVENEYLKWLAILGIPLLSMLGFEFLQNNLLKPIFEWRRNLYFNNILNKNGLADGL